MLLEYFHRFPDVAFQQASVAAFHAGDVQPGAFEGEVIHHFAPWSYGVSRVLRPVAAIVVVVVIVAVASGLRSSGR